MDPVLKTWVGQLHLANCAAYNTRYYGIHVAARRIEMDGERDSARLTDLELIKALKSLSYNCEDEEDSGVFIESIRLLERVIYSLMSRVIDVMLEYVHSETL